MKINGTYTDGPGIAGIDLHRTVWAADDIDSARSGN
jgi:hypothetical protein